MLTWKKPSLSDKALFESFLCFDERESYETSFATRYIWRNYTALEFAVHDHMLIMINHKKGRGSYYQMPCGYKKENIPQIIEYLQQQRPTDYLFGEVDEYFALDVKEQMGDRVELITDRADDEYIYSVEELIQLAGRRFHNKRNHWNAFQRLYSFETKSIDSQEVHDQCLALLREWFCNKGLCDEELQAEQAAISETLNNLKALRLESMALYVDNKVVGFTIGERLTPKMAIIHFEKADASIRGAYNYLNQHFLETHFSDMEFVNRQEDAGDPGLRKAKTDYNPIKMLKKYYIRWKQ
ncbi:hypothetical protein SDC9_127190 [bioreactor metagenome]|uniref:Phosphatidylglycerol lysyltransferase C-terminal domain-containing protein n=1 Tax=bioreactor metagenome TaxID=1076179 RepID=A0A645CTB0_9ZZZZ